MTDHYTLIIAILSALGGTLLGGLSQAFVTRYAAFKESKGIAEALCAELTGILDVITLREYHRHIEEAIERLKDPNHEITVNDITSIRVAEDYFAVFKATAAKIGTLQNVSARVVRTYILAKSLIEDLKRFEEVQKSFLDDEIAIDRVGLLNGTNGLLDGFLMVEREAESTIRELREYGGRKWFKLVR